MLLQTNSLCRFATHSHSSLLQFSRDFNLKMVKTSKQNQAGCSYKLFRFSSFFSSILFLLQIGGSTVCAKRVVTTGSSLFQKIFLFN